jgi:dehydrogenase/reductase SDR family protein 12
MITGANSGLGKETALALAKLGGNVHMVCRNKERGELAQQEIITKTNNANVHLHIVDLSSLAEIKRVRKLLGLLSMNQHFLTFESVQLRNH